MSKVNEKLSKPSKLFMFVNKVADLFRKVGLLSFHLSSEKLLKSAQRQSKLTHFGDELFKKHLQAFLNCFENDNNLNYTGLLLLQGMVKKVLKRRLFLERDLQAHPEILQVPIKHPVIIVGFPRCGTTLLQNLLIQHPGCRWLRSWELNPPFPNEPNFWGSANDPRKLRFDVEAAKFRKRFPQLDVIHAVDSPEECWELFLPTFAGPQILGFFKVEKYRQWSESISEETWQYIYDYYKRQLQHLSWHQPGCHWVLKSPDHLLHLGNLLDIFPDARIVQLHRDPHKFVPSTCNLINQDPFLMTKDSSPKKVGQQILAKLSEWGRKSLAFRKNINPGNFYDIHYQDLVNQPIETVINIYDHFGMEIPAKMKMKLNQWLKEKHGKNRPRQKYRLEQFGLKPADIEREFKDYCQYFQVRLETKN
jgi:hypothetical protein